jgi:hypothetical protein
LIYHRVDIFKHDSWAATALYQSATGTRRVVKFHRQSSVLGLPMAWFGRLVARHERGLLERLRDVEGVPAVAGAVQNQGRRLPNAVARAFIGGHPLARHERVDDAFFPALRQLLETLHRRKIAYVDLHKRENIIVGEHGQPWLIDFQISLAWPRGVPRWPVFELLRRSDEYHLQKHWSLCRPDQCGFDAADLARRRPWWIRLHRLFAQPLREARRRLLVACGVRRGKGRVESELFAEDALRAPASADGASGAVLEPLEAISG